MLPPPFPGVWFRIVSRKSAPGAIFESRANARGGWNFLPPPPYPETNEVKYNDRNVSKQKITCDETDANVQDQQSVCPLASMSQPPFPALVVWQAWMAGRSVSLSV